ncbi:MAG: hypothetical protein M3Y76_01455 [Chloroflexota bacterium]|nr:hypothetical protein [Chloroflexota bacterium]
MTRNLPIYCSLLSNALVPVLLFAAIGLVAACGTAPTGGSPSPTVSTIKGAFSFFTLPTTGSNLAAITSGSDGNIWFTEVTGTSNGPVGKIGRITPSGTITEFALPTGNPNGIMGVPIDITAGPDGYLWFSDAGNNAIGRITTTGSISEFALAAPQSAPEYITSGPGHTLWFSELNSNGQGGKLGRLTIT